jgi:hypothetical protein
MTRLPHLDRAVVSEAKILNYLLSVSHSSGRAKARFLKSFGFRAQDWLILREAIIAHAGANDITASHRSRFGTRYEIDGPLLTPEGRAPIVRGMVRGAAGKCSAPGDPNPEEDWHG